jgi:hypothetical protein
MILIANDSVPVFRATWAHPLFGNPSRDDAKWW